eukprot:TRINITY_DN9455_c0_g1_i2.p1 TRINITY_DN9455_c0_g1~~TRINITY_DN9455_c0_g1_i2.p1  ORF type:complete len:322 (-),score=94.50 TRINITY_DN9455_c0_g1_i2:142-1107(-)
MTVYGAMYGMESFSQLVSERLLSEEVAVQDAPGFRHRGLMVDTGRRFLPIPLLRSIIDGLGYTKMNVLHLHLSDEPAVRFESKLYPELTAGLNGAFYTQEELQALVAYAKQRGVRVEPEIDVPAHAGGFKPLVSKGIQYCDEQMTTLSDSASTLAVLDALFKEVAGVFNESEVIHFGADEACKSDVCPGNCTFDSVHALEKHMQQTIAALGKTPVGWNDVFSDPKTSAPNAALPGTVIQNWGKSSLDVFAAGGFHALDSAYQSMYLSQQCCSTSPPTGPHDKYSLCYWKDTASNVLPAHLGLIDGGEVAMWSDMYLSLIHI